MPISIPFLDHRKKGSSPLLNFQKDSIPSQRNSKTERELTRQSSADKNEGVANLMISSESEKTLVYQKFEKECQYWINVSSTATTKDEKEHAARIHTLFSDIKEDILTFQLLPPPQVILVLDRIERCLTQLKLEEFSNFDSWITHFTDLVLVYALMKTPSCSLLATTTSISRLCTLIEPSMTITERWLQTLQLNHPIHPHPAFFQFNERLSYINDLLACLLASSQAGATFDASELLAPMSTLNWNSEDVTWQTGMKQVDYLIQPCETFLAVTIKKTMEEDKHLLYRNWTKYMAIMKRLKIKNELSTERSVMRAQIQADLDMMERTLRDYSISACTLSDTVTDRMLWIHQSQARLRECDVMIQCIDVETNTYYVHHRHIQEELGRCRQQLLEEFHATAFQVRDQVLQQPHLISLHLSKGKLQVLYPDELGTLVHQVRQLLAFQCVLDPTLIKLAEEAQTQFKTAMVLRQLAHFYNTLESQVLPFHHAMLLPYVNQVEHCIKQPVHWKDPISVQRYLQNLYDATQEVQVQATTLQHAHHAIITVQLKMLQHPGESHWTSGLNEIQQLLNSHPWPSEALVPWKVHLQWQLYKISRHTYPTHLKKDTLPILHVDAIAKQGKVILRPPLEEVKRQYYRALLHHIFHPTRLPGLLQLPLGYTDIIETHAPDVIALYQQAHDMFETLEKKLLVYDEWVFLGAISKESLMDYVSKYTSKFEIDEWEGQFKVLKMKGKEAENLGTSFTVHHVTCSLFTLKAFIDEYLQRLFDALVQCLYKRIQDHAKVVQAFLDQGVQLVTITPRTFHELSLALEKHSQLQFTTIQQEWQQLQQKRTLFRSVTGTTPEMGDLVSRYQQVELMLKGHVLLLQDTRAQFDSQLDARIDQVQSHLHRLHEQWTHVSTSMSLDDFVSLVSDMENQLGNLKEECLYFGRTYPTMELFDNLRTMVHQACEAREVESQFYADVSPFLDALLGLVQIDALKNVLLPWKEKLNPQLTLNSTKTMLDVHKLLEGLWSIQAEWAMYFREVHAFGSQHWEELCQIVGITPSTHKMTLRMLVPNVSLLVSHADALAALNVRAKNEFVIREALQDIDMWSVACTFTLTKNTILNNNAGTSNSTVALLKDIKGIFSELGDQRASVTSLLHTPHAASFMELLTYWDQRLANLDQCLRHLWQVQRKWVYLGPVIQALPLHHQHTFTHVDLQFKTIMSKIDENPKVLHLLNQPNLLQQLPTMVQTLETCQKALLEFLELKRTSFPRFYFIGDDDLLEILSQSNTNPSVVQSHLKKLFSGIHQVLMDNTQSQVTHIVSVNGERVSLLHPITVSDQVDAWLSKLHLEIQSTLQTYLKQGIVQLNAYSTSKEPFASFFSSYPEQIRDLIFRIHMTRKIEDAIQTHNLQGLLNTLKEMSPRPSYDTLYYERVIQSLIEGNVTHLDAFSWTKTLRYYYDNDHCVIRIFDCSLDYTFEYQGNPSKLVQTPLTDTCFATLGQAMSEGLGGCLYGQAGTGKTESVKHLGYLLGRQVLVFNCDEGLDVNSMTRLFCGLVKCGAWGCFDEFNRLSSSVLAAISNLVATIQHALFHKSSSLVLSNTTIEVNPSACLFVTLNPVGKEYQGRQKLPDNLKQLFRNMAMTYPDIIYICQIELKTFGWKDADTLGRLVVDFFQACKHILSPQKHYDWGLRALKAVIWTAGDAHRSQPQMNETIVLIQSLKSNTESKLTKTDLHFFLILLEAYFKNTDLQVSHEDFNVALDVAYNELNLSPTLEQQRKSILQFQTALKQRMGVCLVGPPSSGKATLIKLLARVMQYLKKQVKVCWISPKSMPRTQLLGYLDPLTREWHDGVITLCARETLEAPDTFFFLVFDGDIDPEWVEALNSVLDDNRLLTMPNGERIKFEKNVNFVFLTDSLELASPATVTRLGIIYLDQLIPNDVRMKSKEKLVASTTSSSTFKNKLILGELGSGRKKFVQKLCEKKELIWIQCSQQSSAEQWINIILQYTNLVTQLQGPTLIPKSGAEFLVIIFCDVDLPQKDKFQTSQAHQFIHQLVKHKGFHHPKSLEWITLSCIHVLCTASTVAALNKRVSSKFEIENVPSFSLNEFLDFSLSSLQDSDLEKTFVSKIYSVFKNIFEKAGNVLALKKWLHSFIDINDQLSKQKKTESYYLCLTSNFVFYQLGILCFNDSKDRIMHAIQNEFKTSTPPPLEENIYTMLKEKEDLVLTTSQFQAYFQTLLIALLSYSLPIIHIKASPGIPINDMLHLLSKFLSIPLCFIVYSKVASLHAFYLQMKEVLAITGVQNKKTILVLDAHNCPTPEFYHVVHQIYAFNLVSEAIIPDLSEAENAYQAATYLGTLESFVLSRVQVNLKLIILNMPARFFPWFPLFLKKGMLLQCEDWSASTLTELTDHLESKSLSSALIQMYQSPQVQVTPRSLTYILHLFDTLHHSSSVKLQKKYTYLERGLAKLTATKASVEVLSKNAAEQKSALHERQKLADATLKQITETMVNASNQKIELEQLSIQLKNEEENISNQKLSIQLELSQVEPLIQQAKSAVSEIKSEHLSEVRSLRSPPVTVRDVLEGVLTLLGQQDLSWASMKGVLGRRSFKEDILTFNASSITASIRNQVEKLLKEKPDSFIEANVRKSSVAAAPLANWIIANLEYSKVLDKVKPLQLQLDKLNISLEKSKSRIQDITVEVNSVDEKVNQLKQDFASKTGEAQKLADGLATTQSNLTRAHQLLQSLSSEEHRWQNELQQLEVQLEELKPMSLLAAMYNTWATPLNEDGRKNFVDTLLPMLNLRHFDFVSFTNPLDCEIEWEDSISMENVLAIVSSSQTTYWIADGNGKGLLHLRRYYERSSSSTTSTPITSSEPPLKLISVLSETYVKELEMAIRLGHHVLLTDVMVDDPHAWLFPILRREYQKVHGRLVLYLKDNKQVDVHPQFKLMLYTSYAGWDLLPSLRGHVIQVCWSTTTQGLLAILLREITFADSPETLSKLTNLTSQERHLRNELTMVENQMLEELNQSEGNDLLNNQNLFKSLLDSKSKGQTVSESLMTSRQLQEEMKAQQSEYLSMLTEVSDLYFLVRKLSWIRPHYRFNLNTFVNWFKQALALHPKQSSESTSTFSTSFRLKAIFTSIVHIIYQQTSLCMESLHQLMFGMYLLVALKIVPQEELQVFCGFDLGSRPDASKFPSWVPETKKEILSRFACCFDVSKFLKEGSENAWLKWMERLSETVPCTCSPFQQLLLTSALCPDALFTRWVTFLNANLPEVGVSSNLAITATTMALRRPVLVFVPAGANPWNEFDSSLVGKAPPLILSLGEGMESHVTTELEKVVKEGGTLILQNLQALPSFIPICNSLLNGLEGKGMHPESLLLLSCDEDQTHLLPVELLEQCLLVRVQRMDGFYNHLQHLLTLPTHQQLQGFLTSKNQDVCRQLQKFFLVSWFHALVQERRRFVPQAWHTNYEFGMNDYQSILKYLDRDLLTLQGFIQLIYGSKVDAPMDVLKLSVLVKSLVDEDVLDKEGKMPLRKLLRNFDMPKSNQLQEYMAAIQSLKEVKEHTLLLLPPNADATVYHFKIKLMLESMKRLLKKEPTTPSMPSSTILPSTSTLPTLHTSAIVSKFAVHYQTTVHPLPYTCSSLSTSKKPLPMLAFLQAQYHALLSHANQIELRLTSPTIINDEELLSALDMNTTPYAWQKWIPEPNLQSYPSVLQATSMSLLHYVKTYDAHPETFPTPLPLSLLSSPSGFFSLWQAMLGSSSSTSNVSQWVLLGTFSKTLLQNSFLTQFYLQGAVLDRVPTTQVQYHTPAFQPCDMYLKFDNEPPKKSIRVPLYKDSTREVLVTEIVLVVEDRVDAQGLALSGFALVIHPT